MKNHLTSLPRCERCVDLGKRIIVCNAIGGLVPLSAVAVDLPVGLGYFGREVCERIGDIREVGWRDQVWMIGR